MSQTVEARTGLSAILPIGNQAHHSKVNGQRAREAAGRKIEVLFTDESQALFVDVFDDSDADHVAVALVDCIHAATFDDGEGRLHEALDGHVATVRWAP